MANDYIVTRYYPAQKKRHIRAVMSNKYNGKICENNENTSVGECQQVRKMDECKIAQGLFVQMESG